MPTIEERVTTLEGDVATIKSDIETLKDNVMSIAALDDVEGVSASGLQNDVRTTQEALEAVHIDNTNTEKALYRVKRSINRSKK